MFLSSRMFLAVALTGLACAAYGCDDGENGADGAPGGPGDPGPTGPQGGPGPAGADALECEDGKDAPLPKDGKDAKERKDGAPGTDGVDGESCFISGTTIFSPDGTSMNVQELDSVQGAQGMPGPQGVPGLTGPSGGTDFTDENKCQGETFDETSPNQLLEGGGNAGFKLSALCADDEYAIFGSGCIFRFGSELKLDKSPINRPTTEDGRNDPENGADFPMEGWLCYAEQVDPSQWMTIYLKLNCCDKPTP